MNDLISRADIVEKLRKNKMIFCKNRVEYFALSKDEKARVDEISNCIAEILNMPSVEPERKTGKWIPDKSGIVYWNCSECGFASEAFGADILYHYCPNCGVKMENE